MVEQSTTWASLCHLLAAGQRPEAPALPGPGSWTSIVELAQRDGVAPQLYAALQQKNLAAPPEIQEQLRQAYYGAARLNTLQFQELDRVLGRLAEAGIPTLALKGAALASTVYEGIAPRPMVDLDILVPRDQVPQVPEALAPLGLPGPAWTTRPLFCLRGALQRRDQPPPRPRRWAT